MLRFAYRFCREHHIIDVPAFLHATPLSNLLGWMASYELDPPLAERMTARTCATIYNSQSTGKTYSELDWLQHYETCIEQDPKEGMARLLAYAATNGNKVIRR